ncbi:MAG: Trm112 family protein [Elusimicrobia bacterium]|nr:Trm112 family protein [Elusimicrobiota bacterium]
MSLVDPELLKILACPACKKPLEEREARKQLACRACAKAYPVDDGIPILLVDRAVAI